MINAKLFPIADLTIIDASETRDVTLQLSQPSQSCRKILWFRYEGSNCYPRLAQYMRSNQSVWYFGESESCPLKYTAGAVSSKFELNTVTGDLTIRNLDLYEAGDYYVRCDEQDEWPRYTLVNLNIHGKF